MNAPQDEHVYSPGETKLVNTSEHSHTEYIGGPTTIDGLHRSQFANRFEGRYDDDLACLKVYELNLYYDLLTDPDFFEDVMGLYGEILGCWCLPEDYCHGVTLVDFLTYGFERSDKDIEDVSNRDEWVLQFIGRQLSAMDSTNLPPMGVAFRARLEEKLASINGDVSDCSFAAHLEDYEEW